MSPLIVDLFLAKRFALIAAILSKGIASRSDELLQMIRKNGVYVGNLFIGSIGIEFVYHI